MNTKAQVAKVSWAVGLCTSCLVNHPHMKHCRSARVPEYQILARCYLMLQVGGKLQHASSPSTRYQAQLAPGQLSNRLFSARNLDLQRHTADLMRLKSFGPFETCNPHRANSHQCHSSISRLPALTRIREICSKHQELKWTSLQAGPTDASVTHNIGRMRSTISPLRRLAYFDPAS